MQDGHLFGRLPRDYLDATKITAAVRVVAELSTLPAGTLRPGQISSLQAAADTVRKYTHGGTTGSNLEGLRTRHDLLYEPAGGKLAGRKSWVCARLLLPP